MGAVERSSGYLDDGRLVDVLALIQVLGVGGDPRRTERELRDEIILGGPTSRAMSRWCDVAKQHPEFFRVAGVNQDSVCLTARHAAGPNDAQRVLTAEFVQKLLETATEIHDREMRRSQRWTLFVPLWVAAIAGVVTIITTSLGLLLHRG